MGAKYHLRRTKNMGHIIWTIDRTKIWTMDRSGGTNMIFRLLKQLSDQIHKNVVFHPIFTKKDSGVCLVSVQYNVENRDSHALQYCGHSQLSFSNKSCIDFVETSLCHVHILYTHIIQAILYSLYFLTLQKCISKTRFGTFVEAKHPTQFIENVCSCCNN